MQMLDADSNPEGSSQPGISDLERRALQELMQFPLMDAMFGRRSRRFFLGAEIPDGPLAHRSRFAPMPLSELERLLILMAVAGKTGWHNGITRHTRTAPAVSSYAASASGRTFPSTAGFHVSELFFTDDSGTYIFRTRDAVPPAPNWENAKSNVLGYIKSHAGFIEKLSDTRLHLPPMEPFMGGHNAWNANKPGTLLTFPVADVAQHQLLKFIFLAQNGFVIYDDVHNRRIPGLEKFAKHVNLDRAYPITSLDQSSLGEVSAELSTSTFSGMLMQQAMGLGGWMLNGLDRLTILGASGNPEVPGLGFQYDQKPGWVKPNPTGLPGVFEATVPPNFKNMRAAVEFVVERKEREGGPSHTDTPGPWKDSNAVRANLARDEEWVIDLVATQAQYLYDTFGKYPATVPTIYILMHLQTHHLDLEYYDQHFAPGSYLGTHARHMETWHGIKLEDLPKRD
jgi:hypothetical protein